MGLLGSSEGTEGKYYPKLLQQALRDKRERALSVEAAKLPEDESPLMTRMPSIKEAATSGYNKALDAYSGELNRQAELTPEDQAFEMALNSLPIGGIKKTTATGKILESIDKKATEKVTPRTLKQAIKKMEELHDDFRVENPTKSNAFLSKRIDAENYKLEDSFIPIEKTAFDKQMAKFSDLPRSQINKVRKEMEVQSPNDPWVLTTSLSKDNSGHYIANPNFKPTGVIGSPEVASSPGGADAFMWVDSKYEHTKGMLEQYAKNNIPLKEIHTGSDLIGRDDYASLIPNDTKINVYLPPGGATGRPSALRLITAANKLKSEGKNIKVILPEPMTQDAWNAMKLYGKPEQKSGNTIKSVGNEFNERRYPLSKRTLSQQDIKELDSLYYKLNRMQRSDPNWGSTESRIDELLGN